MLLLEKKKKNSAISQHTWMKLQARSSRSSPEWYQHMRWVCNMPCYYSSCYRNWKQLMKERGHLPRTFSSLQSNMRDWTHLPISHPFTLNYNVRTQERVVELPPYFILLIYIHYVSCIALFTLWILLNTHRNAEVTFLKKYHKSKISELLRFPHAVYIRRCKKLIVT